MEQTCRRAVELGLPAVAFTEHVDFTEWGAHDNPPADGRGVDAAARSPGATAWLRSTSTGTSPSIERCRARFPELRILSGIEAGEPHQFAGSVAAVLTQGSSTACWGRCTRSCTTGGWSTPTGVRRDRPADAVVRDYFAELVRLVEDSDVFQVLAHCDFPAGTGRIARRGVSAKRTTRRSTAPCSVRWPAPTGRSSSTPAARSRRPR